MHDPHIALGSEIASHLIHRLRIFVQEQFREQNLSEEDISNCVLALLHESPVQVLQAIAEPIQVISIFLADMPADVVQNIFELAIQKFQTSRQQIDTHLLQCVKQTALAPQKTS